MKCTYIQSACTCEYIHNTKCIACVLRGNLREKEKKKKNRAFREGKITLRGKCVVESSFSICNIYWDMVLIIPRTQNEDVPLTKPRGQKKAGTT